MSTSTTPSGLSKVAPTGQTWTQGEWAQWLQSFGTKKFFAPSSAPVLLGEAVVAAVRRVDLGVLDVALRARGSARPRSGSRRARGGRRSPPCRPARSCRSRCTSRCRWSSPTSGRWSCSSGRPPAPRAGRPRRPPAAAPVSSSSLPERARKSRRSGLTSHPARSSHGSGLWALWQVVQASPPACSAGSTCGKRAGRATFAAWHRAQSTPAVGADRLLLRGVPRVRGERAVAGLAADPGVGPALRGLRHVGVALHAGRAPGEGDGPRPVLLERSAPGSARRPRSPWERAGPAARGRSRSPPRTAPPSGRGAPCARRDRHECHPPLVRPPRAPDRAREPGSLERLEANVIFEKIVASAKSQTAHAGASKGPSRVSHRSARRGWTLAAASP